MAEQANKEPTMEEILSTIRRIISEDSDTAPPTAKPATEETEDVLEAVHKAVDDAVAEEFDEVSADDFFDALEDLDDVEVEDTVEPAETLSADDIADEFDADEAEEDLRFEDLLNEADDSFEEIEEEQSTELTFEDLIASEDSEPELTDAIEETSDDDVDLTLDATVIEDEVDAEVELDVPAPELDEFDQVSFDDEDDDGIEIEDVLSETLDADFDFNEPAVSEPEEMTAPEPVTNVPMHAENINEPLIGEASANAAAHSLAKLISNVDMTSENNIDGLVRQMLQPMIRAWLDENLPEIVERKVEAEVKRIANMVR